MTHPKRRTRRQPPPFAGDDRTATEVLGPYRGTVHDGAGFQWEGASEIGLPDPAEDYRRAVAQANAEAEALYPAPPHPPYPGAGPGPFGYRGRMAALHAERDTAPHAGPDMFPALREPPPAAPVGYEVTGRETAQGWPHLGELRCAYPAARAETPIPCDSIHRDHTATSFRALRLSAIGAGWHMDKLGHWACPRCCQASPEYRTLYAVTVYDMLAAEAYVTGDLRGENRERARAELALRERTLGHYAASHEHGRHAAAAS